jgi:hypothetical protein
MNDEFNIALKRAKQELGEAVEELGEAQARAGELEQRIADLRQSVSVLSKLCGEELQEVEDALGLTDAIRVTFQEASQPIAAQDVRLHLEARGFNTRRYGNLLASIHTVIGRLEAKKEIKQAGVRSDGKPVYQRVVTPILSRLPIPPVQQIPDFTLRRK